jgi:hypothetical protein
VRLILACLWSAVFAGSLRGEESDPVEVEQTVEFRSEGLDAAGTPLGKGTGRTEFTLRETWRETKFGPDSTRSDSGTRREFLQSMLAIGDGSAEPTLSDGAIVEIPLNSLRAAEALRGSPDPATLDVLGRLGSMPLYRLIPAPGRKLQQDAEFRDCDLTPFLRLSLASLAGASGTDFEKIRDSYAKTLGTGVLPCWQPVATCTVALKGRVATLTWRAHEVVDDHTPLTALRGRTKGTYDFLGTLRIDAETREPSDLEFAVDQTVTKSDRMAAAPKEPEVAMLKESLRLTVTWKPAPPALKKKK